jgi:hypothetical protein
MLTIFFGIAYSQVETKEIHVGFCKAEITTWISADYSDDGESWSEEVSDENFAETINDELTYFDGDETKPFLTKNQYYYPHNPKRTSDYKSGGTSYQFNSYGAKSKRKYTMNLVDGNQEEMSASDYPTCLKRLKSHTPISQSFLWGFNIKTKI